jgi:tetratricopeptide (TPR) repeat protein
VRPCGYQSRKTLSILGNIKMKSWKLAAAILLLGTLTFTPKAEAKDLFKTRQLITQAPNSQTENSNNAETYFRRGFERLLKQKDYQGAIEDFTQFLKIYPNNSDAYFGRGFSYFILKDYQSAKNDFDKALENNPENKLIPNILQFRGICRFELKDKPGAIADLQKASALYKQLGEQEGVQQVERALKIVQEN